MLAEVLPIRAALKEGESLESYVRRTAALNHRRVEEVLGRRPRVSVWEAPSPAVIRHLIEATGESPPVLASATLPRRYPGVSTGGWHLGRRYRESTVWCPRCGPNYDVELRIQPLVTCSRCDLLLTDARGHREDEVDPLLAAEQRQLRSLLRQQPSRETLERLRRLQTLLYGLSRVITTEWPPLAPGESPKRRVAAVGVECQLRPGVKVHRPPVAMAVLLRLCWSASSEDQGTAQLLEQIRIRSRSPLGARHAQPRLANSPRVIGTASWAEAALPVLGPEHIPHAFTLDVDDIMPLRHEFPLRSAYSLLLVQGIQSRDAGQATSFAEAGRLLGSERGVVKGAVVRLAGLLRQEPGIGDTMLRLTNPLIDPGLIDYRQRRAEFRHRRDVPTRVLRQLPPPTREHDNVPGLAAAWVWLDATRGVPSGGPNPNLSHAALRAFHQALGPDGRLTLRQFWLEELGQTQTMLDIATPSVPTTGHQETRPA